MSRFGFFQKLRSAVAAGQSPISHFEPDWSRNEQRILELFAARKVAEDAASTIASAIHPAVASIGEPLVAFDVEPSDPVSLGLAILSASAKAPKEQYETTSSFDAADNVFDRADHLPATFAASAMSEPTPAAQATVAQPESVELATAITPPAATFPAAMPVSPSAASPSPAAVPREPSLADLLAALDAPVGQGGDETGHVPRVASGESSSREHTEDVRRNEVVNCRLPAPRPQRGFDILSLMAAIPSKYP